MKRRKIFLSLTVLTAVLILVGLILLYGGITHHNTALIVIGSVLAAASLILTVVFQTVSSRADRSLLRLWFQHAQTAGAATDASENGERKETDYAAELSAVRERYRSDPDPKKNRIEKPGYLNKSIFYDKSVLQKGTVYYGCLVEANDALFRSSRSVWQNLPAVFLYSTDESFERRPDDLIPIALSLEKNKDSNFLKNETRYFSNLRLPDALTGGRTVYATVVPVCRRQLPFGQFFYRKIVPLIADPFKSDSAFLIDSRYWTDALVAEYLNYRPEMDESYGYPFEI